MARTAKKPVVQQRRRAVPWRAISILGVVVAAVALILVFDEPAPGVTFEDQGNRHLETVDEAHVAYNSSPPSSGPHLGFIADWGVAPETVPPELFVHNLEDGGVVLTYDCADGCPDLVSELTSFVDERGGRLLLTPYSGIGHDGVSYRAAAVAWGRVFYFDTLDEMTLSELDLFVRLYEGVDHHVAGTG